MKSFNQYSILLEDIRSKVKKLRKLSPEDKKRVIDFFKQNRHLEDKIDWNNKNLTITDFQVVFHTPTKAKIKKAVKKRGISGLQEGIDYIDVTYMFENHNAYIPLTYEASKHIASSYIGRCTGKWCTAYQKTDEYWTEYVIENKIMLIYLVSPDKAEKYAIALSIKLNKWEIFDELDNKIKTIPGENFHRIYKRYKRDLKKYNEMIDRDDDWYETASTKNAKYRVLDDGIIWYSGTWIKGRWKMVLGKMVHGKMVIG
jgi:hypothetical protein